MDRLFRALPQLKEELEINIELASPDPFIPELPGWQERSLFVAREGRLSFYHYDLFAQALAKIERGPQGSDVALSTAPFGRVLWRCPVRLRPVTDFE